MLADVTAFCSVWVELWADDPAAAAEFGAAGVTLHEQSGEQGALSTAVGFLAQALYALDRLDEADTLAGRAAELGASDDVVTQMQWRQVQDQGARAHKVSIAEAETPRTPRPSRSAKELTSSTGRAMHTPTSPRCS